MRTPRAWAVARTDGTVASGLVPPTPAGHIPIVRVLVGVVLGLKVGFGRARSKSKSNGFVRAIVVTELAVVALDWAAGHLHASRVEAPFLAAVLCLIALLIFRVVAPGPQWSYHGAEHKAVTAYEQGIDLADVDAVLACSRLHRRCGTNLVLWVAMAAPLAYGLPVPVQILAFPLLLGGVAELLSMAARHPDLLISKIAVAPGVALQATLTTTEPTPEQQAVACLALTTCLELHATTVSPEPAPALA